MPSIHIRDVDPLVLQALKRLAHTNHRSLQGELRSIIERAAQLAPRLAEDRALRLVTVRTSGASQWKREEIYGDFGR